ncbi:DUF932 domain-containing protein [Myxococcota bacterium]|nr:DUF932 domain-containing protein [Myxococcota bacterium]
MSLQIQPPWHATGTVLNNHPDTAEQAITQAGLNWTATKMPIVALDGTPVPGQYAVVREDDSGNTAALGVVGRKYKIVQNRSAFTFFDAFVANGLATYEGAGAFKDGRIIWVLAKLRNELRITGNDLVARYLLLTNSHDGSSCVQVMFSPIRLFCSNQLAMLRSINEKRLSIRHTPSVLSKMHDTQEYLSHVNHQFERTADAYRALATSFVNNQDARQYLRTLFPDPGGDAKRNRNRAIREKVTELYTLGVGTEDTRHTYWRLYNAVTEYVDHARNPDNDEARVRSAWLGQGAQLKQKALHLALKEAA